MAADATIELHLPQDLLIGGGASDDLAEHVARIGIERPLVVSDRFLLDKGPAGPLVERLGAGGATVAVFGEVQPDPTLANVEGALLALRDHEADGVVAIGGGSPMDTAKAARLVASTVTLCSKAVAASQGMSEAFSTGSQNHQPPQPSS